MSRLTIPALAREILLYESDTFSGMGSDITYSEAHEVAERLLAIWAERHIDGVIISSVLTAQRHDAGR